jgi:hypothetical protein
MKKSWGKKIRKMAGVVGTVSIAVSLLAISAGVASANKKQKVRLPDYVLKAQTVLVVILPEAGEPMDDPFANRKTQEEVEKAFMKWDRYRLALDEYTADLVIGVRKGTGKAVNPTIKGGPVDTTTDDQVRVGVQQGRPPDRTQQGAPKEHAHKGMEAGAEDDRPPNLTQQGAPNEHAHIGMEAGAENDTFMVFQGGVQNPLDNPPVWTYIAKDGLKPPRVVAVEEFRKVVEESDKAAEQKQQQQQEKGQKKNPSSR